MLKTGLKTNRKGLLFSPLIPHSHTCSRSESVEGVKAVDLPSPPIKKYALDPRNWKSLFWGWKVYFEKFVLRFPFFHFFVVKSAKVHKCWLKLINVCFDIVSGHDRVNFVIVFGRLHVTFERRLFCIVWLGHFSCLRSFSFFFFFFQNDWYFQFGREPICLCRKFFIFSSHFFMFFFDFSPKLFGLCKTWKIGLEAPKKTKKFGLSKSKNKPRFELW